MVAKEEGEYEGELGREHLHQSASHQKCDLGEGWQLAVLLIHQGFDLHAPAVTAANISTGWHE